MVVAGDKMKATTRDVTRIDKRIFLVSREIERDDSLIVGEIPSEIVKSIVGATKGDHNVLREDIVGRN